MKFEVNFFGLVGFTKTTTANGESSTEN